MASDFTVDRNSPKWVLGSDGYLKEYAADEPAIEFNADGSYKGVLVEPAATNRCLQSEDFSTTWVNLNNRLTITTNATTAPDGTTTAFLFAPDSTNGLHIIRQSNTFTNTTYTISVFLKQAGRRYVQVAFGGATLGLPSYDYRRGVFDLQDGVVYSAPTNGTATIQDTGNGWYRCSVTITVVTGGSANFDIYHVDSTDPTITTISDGNGTDGIYIWGAQLEESPIATSYIPTTTGSVTRVKDDIYLTSASSLIGQTEGTLFVEVDWQRSGASFQFLLSANDDSSANFVAIFNTATTLTMRCRNSSSDSTNQGVSSTALTGIQKIAFAYKVNDFELYRNGSSVSTDTSGAVPSATLTNIDFGQSEGGGAQANMWIRAVALYTTRLSDAECEALTTL